MINRYFYKSSLSDFVNDSSNEIFGKMSRADEMDTSSTQKYAWEQEIQIMKRVLQPYENECAEILQVGMLKKPNIAENFLMRYSFPRWYHFSLKAIFSSIE